MAVPDDLSDAIAAQVIAWVNLTSLVPYTGIGGFFDFPYTGPEHALIVSRTLDVRRETKWSHTYGNDENNPNKYTGVLLITRARKGADWSQGKADRLAVLPLIHQFFHDLSRKRLNDGQGGGDLCARSEVTEVKNDPQGPFITYLREPWIGAFITFSVHETYVTD